MSQITKPALNIRPLLAPTGEPSPRQQLQEAVRPFVDNTNEDASDMPPEAYQPADAENDLPPHLLTPTTEQTGLIVQPKDALDTIAEASPAVAKARRLRERKQLISDAFKRSFIEGNLTFEELLPQRIKAVWRLTREMARHRGFLAPDETLLSALQPEYRPPPIDGQEIIGEYRDRWTRPEALRPPRFNSAFPTFKLDHNILMAMNIAERVHQHFQVYDLILERDREREVDRIVPQFYPGVALMPPEVPYVMRTDDNEPVLDLSMYDPRNREHDPCLHAYIAVLRYTANSLHIDLGSKNDPNLGRYGLAGLFDPLTIRFVYPSQRQIIAYETLMMDETMAMMVEKGTPFARRHLRDQYGLQPHEVTQIVRMTMHFAHAMMDVDVEQSRAMMIMRLEDVARRARESIDLRAELAALKNLALVTGITRSEPENALKEFVDMVRDVSERRESGKFVESVGSPRSLPVSD